jgi:rhamnose transport system permease protein
LASSISRSSLGWFGFFGQTAVGGLVPVQLIFLVLLAIAFSVVLSRTSFGRNIYAIGNNELAVRFSGVNTASVKIAVYTLTGLLVGMAGVIHTSRIFSARANAGYGLELTVIAMVVLGGAKITGGSGTIFGTIMGVLILAYLQDGLVYAGVRSDWGLLAIGVFLIASVFLNEFFRRGPR